MRADNGAGIRLYERRGYVRFAVRPDYYEDGMEAWRYEKALVQDPGASAGGSTAAARRARTD